MGGVQKKKGKFLSLHDGLITMESIPIHCRHRMDIFFFSGLCIHTGHAQTSHPVIFQGFIAPPPPPDTHKVAQGASSYLVTEVSDFPI